MSKIIALLMGTSGPWILLGASIGLFVAGSGAGYMARGLVDAPKIALAQKATAEAEKATQKCIADTEKDRADGNQKVVDDLTRNINTLQGVITDMQIKENARKVADQNFMKALANAPKTSICGTAPAERAYRDSVRGIPPTPAVPR